MHTQLPIRVWRRLTHAVFGSQLPTLRVSPTPPDRASAAGASKPVTRRVVTIGPCILVRPGETDFQRQGRIAGSLDLPLNDIGTEETMATIAAVRTLAPRSVLTGLREPSHTTAHALATSLRVPLRETELLDNVNYGLWQGLLVDDIRQKQPKLFKKWQDCPQDVTPPQGEDCGSALKRVEFALRKPLSKKDAFVVVASEPLASLVASVVRGVKPSLSGPVGHCRPLVESIERDASDRVGGARQRGLGNI